MEKNIDEYFDNYGDITHRKYVSAQHGRFISLLYVDPIDSQKFLNYANSNKWIALSRGTSFTDKREKFGFYKINEHWYCRFDSDSPNPINRVAVFYFPEEDREKLLSSIPLKEFVLKQNETNIYLLVANGRAHDFVPFEIKTPKIDLERHYNHGFQNFHEKLRNLCASKENGIVLLHGSPGTGKTSYLKYLASLVDRKFLYVTPGMADWIGSSDFNSIMQDEKDAVLIIEDAEISLGLKNKTRSQATSNLLNITDGILADCFNTLVICTFNAGINQIDEALVRPGRLKGQYEFLPLSKSLVHDLTAGLHDSPMTIAEVYNANEKEGLVSRKIGFAS